MRDDGMSLENLDVGVQRLMSLMEPSYLEARTETAIAMRHLLFAGAIAVANADDNISEKEIAAFEKFFGAREFSDELDIPRTLESLSDRIQRANDNASQPQKMQVLRDICLVANADGCTNDHERQVLHGIADGLGISHAFVYQTLTQDCEPD